MIDEKEAMSIIERFSVSYGNDTPPTSALQAARRAAASVITETRRRESSLLFQTKIN